MRVGLKLAVVILALLVAVLGVEGLLRLGEERALFEADVRHEQQLLGRALRPSIELAFRTEGWSAAQAILARAQAGEGEVRVRLVALHAGAFGGKPVVAFSSAAPPLADAGLSIVQARPEPGMVYTYVPIRVPTTGTAIELSESLQQAEERLDESAARVAWTALVMILGGGVLAISMGERIVGRPVRLLAAQAARIAAGGLTPPSPTRRQE